MCRIGCNALFVCFFVAFTIPELEKKPLLEVPTLTTEALGRVRTISKNSLVMLNRLPNIVECLIL